MRRDLESSQKSFARDGHSPAGYTGVEWGKRMGRDGRFRLEPDESLGENGSVQFLEWNHHIESLEQMSGFHAQEKEHAREGLLYLQNVLGDDFLQRCSTEIPFVARHPILQWLANFAPSSRRSIARFGDHLRMLEGSQNLGNVLVRLHDITQFNHDALLIKSAWLC